MSRELNEIERAALEPLVERLERNTQERCEIEERLQSLCGLMVEDGQAVDLETMTVTEKERD